MTKRTQALAFGFLLLLAAAAFAQIPNIPPFSADLTMSGAALRGHETTGKMYWGGNRMRWDMSMQGHESIMITDVASRTSYMIMPQQHMYMEFNANNAMAQRMGHAPDIKPYNPDNPCASMEGYTCKKVGTETVNGRQTDKWEFKSPQDTRTVWIDQKLHFPIRSVDSRGTTFELTNIKEGPQPASLFQVPAGYTKMDLGGMMGRRPPQ